MTIGDTIISLLILPLPIASISWTMTHEEVFREIRQWCQSRSQRCDRLYKRKFFYLFTCEYCLSHWVTALVLALTRFHLLYGDWRGYFVAGFSLVWIANVYMSFYGRIRLDLKRERVEIAVKEQKELNAK